MRKMGFLGPLGTHSEAAALYLNSLLRSEYQLEACENIYAAIQAVEQGELDACLVPVENSIEGSINITLDTLARSDDLCVIRELIWSVHNHLMVKDPQVPITKILSHSQPLSQCRDYIREHYPQARLDAVVSTAAAASMVEQADAQEGYAAICTKRGGELHGLQILDNNIEDQENNCTRFYQLVRRDQARFLTEKWLEHDKSLIICQIDGKDAGQLCKVLLELAIRAVNLTRIESRPARTGLGEYIFFLDVEMPHQKENLDAALDAIRKMSVWVRQPGKFPVIKANN